jgi:hypothetical protein
MILRQTIFLTACNLSLCIAMVACTSYVNVTTLSAQIVDTKVLARKDHLAELAVRVSFSTDVKLVELVKDNEYNIGNAISLCSDGKFDSTKILQGGIYDFNDSGLVDAYRATQLSPDVYYFDVYLKSVPLAGKPNTFIYDLHYQPEDICFYLRGGNMIGQTIHSNTAILPKELLRDALSRAGL